MTGKIHITTDHDLAIDVTISIERKRKTYRIMPDSQRSFDMHENAIIRVKPVDPQAEEDGDVPPAANRR